MVDTLAVQEAETAPSVSTTRRGGVVSLIVIHHDPRPAAEALTAYTAPDAVGCPHYYVAADGTITRLVDEERAAKHCGIALWDKRRRNIDKISLGIVLEHSGDSPYAEALLAALHPLLDRLQAGHSLDDSALVRWQPAIDEGIGTLVPFLPPAEGTAAFAGNNVVPYEPPLVLGPEDETETALRLWTFLHGQSHSQRGGSFKFTLHDMARSQAFPVFAAKHDLGAPLAANGPEPASADGRSYNFQVYARDTIFNEGRNWSAVQGLNSLLDDKIPAGGAARALIEAGYRSSLAASAAKTTLQGNQKFNAEWRFHFVAFSERLGPALSGNYITADKQWIVQVFAGDTLYTPASNQSGSLRLSQATPESPEFAIVWAETYKIAGASFDPNSPFHQFAAQSGLGTPLSGVFTANFEGSPLQIQVFAFDTIYSGADGQIKRLSALPKPAEVQAWQPAPASPPPPPPAPPAVQIAAAGAAGAPVRDTNWPPFPNFDPLPNNEARFRELGHFDFQPSGGGNIRILGSWIGENIVDVEVPQLARFIRGGSLKFHRRAAEQLRALWAAWEAAGLLHLVLTFDGAWVPRFIRGSSTQLSNHAFGTAFDINARWNGLGVRAALVGDKGSLRELAPIANAHGFYWGGHFRYVRGSDVSDGMHFEWARPI